MYPLIPAPDDDDDDDVTKLLNEARDRLKAIIRAMPDAELESENARVPADRPSAP